MKMSDSPAKRAWIEQVLGFKFPAELKPDKPDLGRRWQLACQAWRAASAAVDAQISALQTVLRSSGDPDLMEIAEFGLNAVTGNHKVRLTGMLLELGDASPPVVQQSGSKALALLSQFQTHIETDKRVAACDSNPSPVRVSIRATIGPALAGLQAALEAARAQ
jgi:hypothetical protein